MTITSSTLLADLSDATLRTDPPPPSAERTNVGAAIGHVLCHHHAALRANLPYLDDLLTSVLVDHGEDDPDLVPVEVLFGSIHALLDIHLDRSENEIFPLAIRMMGAIAHPCLDPYDVVAALRDLELGNERLERDLIDLANRLGHLEAPTSESSDLLRFRRGIEWLVTDTRERLRFERELLIPALLELNASLD